MACYRRKLVPISEALLSTRTVADDEGVRKDYSRRNPPSRYEEMNQPDNHKSHDKPREGLDDPQVAHKLANGASFVFRKSSPVLLRFEICVFISKPFERLVQLHACFR